MITNIKTIKNTYSIELSDDILKRLKIKDTDDVEVSLDGNTLLINNIKIKELNIEERLNIHSIKNNFKKLDWGEA